MNRRGLVLLVILLALIGMISVHEVLLQTRMQYDLARLTEQKEDLHDALGRAKAELARLQSPAQLLQTAKSLGYTPLTGAEARPLTPIRVASLPSPERSQP